MWLIVRKSYEIVEVFTHTYDLSTCIAFQVLHSNQGAQGLLGKPSNQQLDTVFGSHKDIDVVTVVLEKGSAQHGKGIRNSDFGATNSAHGSQSIDSRGKGSTSGI
jgi:hypothetical protein